MTKHFSGITWLSSVQKQLWPSLVFLSVFRISLKFHEDLFYVAAWKKKVWERIFETPGPQKVCCFLCKALKASYHVISKAISTDMSNWVIWKISGDLTIIFILKQFRRQNGPKRFLELYWDAVFLQLYGGFVKQWLPTGDSRTPGAWGFETRFSWV